MKKDTETLRRAFEAWQSAADFRRRRTRQKRYTFGEQWIDTVKTDTGRTVTEAESLSSDGRTPITNNLLRRMVKTIVGIYRSRSAESELYDLSADSADRRNCLPELDARMLEEFIISGAAVQRVVREDRGGGSMVWVDNVDPRRFFWERFNDPRGLDAEFVGMLHDFTLPQLISRFARGSRSIACQLRLLHQQNSTGEYFADEIIGFVMGAQTEFFNPADRRRMRVVEVWSRRDSTVISGNRVKVDFSWHCQWIAPDGTVLDEYNSPYPHASHPFTFKFYPLIDGEIHSFVEDVIDQQRNVNRLLTLTDTILARSSKGTLLFPNGQLLPGMDLKTIAESWAKPGAVIPITDRGTLPHVVDGGEPGRNAREMLDLHMSLFDKTSGITDSLLGQNISAATGAELYNAQVRNSTTILTDLLESFASFITSRNAKM